MAFLDENGLAQLWSLIKAADGKLQTAIDSGVKIAYGSYVGTGKSGSSNPNTLTFGFAPKLLVMFDALGKWTAGPQKPYDDGTYENVPAYGCPAALTTSYQTHGLFLSNYDGQFYAKRSEDGKTVYWYHNGNSDQQMNKSGTTYHYVAIG